MFILAKKKSILFGRKGHLKSQTDLNIKYGDIKIKQHNNLVCIVDNNLSGEPMATKLLGPVNGRLKFLHRKQRFLTYRLRRSLCNALIQPHYDYACYAWYPSSLSKRLLKQIQISQNKCIRYCLKLDNTSHVGVVEFKKLNWLPTKQRVYQCICVSIFKFFNDMSQEYTSADTIHAPRRLFLMFPFGNTVPAKKLYPALDQEHGIRYQLK